MYFLLLLQVLILGRRIPILSGPFLIQTLVPISGNVVTTRLIQFMLFGQNLIPATIRHRYGRHSIDKVVAMMVSFLFLFHFMHFDQLLILIDLLLKIILRCVILTLFNIEHPAEKSFIAPD